MDRVDERPARVLPWWLVGVLGALTLGALFRLAWADDMEYKLDEAWTMKHILAAGRSEPLPVVGMPSSLGPPNPALSFWVTWGLSRSLGIDSPLGMVRMFQLLNVAALVALTAFILLSIPKPQREAWLWALALGAVNPLSVLFQRKIWPPALGPLFAVAWLAGWWHRRTFWGALTWGLVGALLGQLHAMGFFLAGGVFVFTLLFGRRDVHWKAWFLGSVLGTLTMLPWLYFLATQPRELHDDRGPALRRLFEAKFYTHWMTEPFGLGLTYPLGREYGEFLSGPTLHGQPTYLVGALQLVCVAVGATILVRAVRGLWQRRAELRSRLLGAGSETSLLVSAVFWGSGLLLCACCLRYYRHYLVMAFPLPVLWAAVLALRATPGREGLRRGRLLLGTLCVSQALLTASFLYYIHVRNGHINGDYALPYRIQVERGEVHNGEI